jgi:large subunit ribosomal protein L17
MRHRKSFNHLGRTANHRNAMMANMAASLILHKRIKTTTAKAKALRVFVEPLITKSKDDSTHARRMAFSFLQNKEAVTELFREVSPKIADRPGGYTRILKTGTRLGDNADMCIIELVDYNANLLAAKEEAAAKSGRRRRRGTKKKETAGQTAVAEVGKVDVVEEEAPENTKVMEVSEDVQVEETDVASDDIKAQEDKGATEEKKEE